MTPDLRYSDRSDASMRPSWNANPGFVNAEHRSAYSDTRDLPGWQEEGDSYKLYEMGYFAGDVILEIGVYGGRSAVVELRGALGNPARGRAPQFFGIDLDPAAIGRSYKTLVDHGLAEYALLYQGDLEHFVAEFCIRPTMVFVDGDHQYPGIKGDLQTLSEILGPGVPVLCHDYCNPENDTGQYGVRRAATEWEEAGYAEFAGVFGCAALLVTTGRCHGPYGGLSPEHFAARRLELLRRDGLVEDPVALRIAELEARIQACETERAASAARLRDFEEQLQAAAAGRARDSAAIRNLQERVAVLLTTRSALRRLAGASARRIGVYNYLKRRF
jgi:hypothetical protein